MKELSIEEKAKAYDEAKARMSKACNSNRCTIGFMNEIFPELKESEDERIRTGLINGFKECLKKSNYPKNAQKYWHNIKIEDILAWLEKQGEQNLIMAKSPQLGEQKSAKNIVETWKDMRLEVYQQASGNRHEPNYSDDTTKMFSLNDIDEIIEKMSEQKLADKVEPKFNFSVGQWIVATGKCVYLITKIDGFNVTLVDVDGNEYVFDTSSLEDAHLWTIQDAKDGDVLFHSDSASNGIFIFKEIIDKGFAKEIICYCDYDSEDHFCLGEHHTCCWADAKILHPATKEQRDTLEKAMTDAGYIFDFESKELKKLGQSEVTKMSDQEEIAEIPFGAKDSELQEVTYYIPKGFHAEIDDDKIVIKKGEKPTAWSEEDNMMIEETLYFLREYQHSNRCKDENGMQNSVTCRKWLKSLKDRVQPHSKQEWSVEDKSKVQRICKNLDEAKKYYADITEVRECMDWLKSLEDRVGCEANCTTTKEWNESDKEEFQIAIDTLVEAGQHDSAHWLKSLKQRIGG